MAMDFTAMFEAAAQALEAPAGAADAEGVALLDWLGCPRPDPPDATARHRARLLRAAAGFRRVFTMACDAAPGFTAFGAEVDPAQAGAVPGLPVINVAGGDADPLRALERCAGEGIERLSCLEAEADAALVQPAPAVPPAWLGAEFAGAPHWLPAQRLTGDAASVLLPAEYGRWRPPARRHAAPPLAASLGCAAGPTLLAAMEAGLCEVIERDAVALWWRGGRRGRPLALEQVAAAGALAARLREGAARPRQGWLLDLTTDLGVPVVAAVSVAAGGGEVCIGTAARPTIDRAATAAVRDLVLAELAVELVMAKRAAGGDAALNAADEAHLRRSAALDPARHPILLPVGPPRDRDAAPVAPAGWPPGLASMLDRLARAGQEVLAIDLTRARFGVPVVRMLCPGLETLPSAAEGPRLRAARALPDADGQHAGIPLM